MNALASGIGTFAALGTGYAVGATTLGIGAVKAFQTVNDDSHSTPARTAMAPVTAASASVAVALGLGAAMAAPAAFAGVYGDTFGAARGPVAGRTLAFATTAVAVAAGVGAVVAGANALDIV